MLSPEEQKGLIGELIVLERYLVAALSPVDAIACWRGPLGAAKDFVVGSTAVESKARSTATAALIPISSEFQLDDSGFGALFLHLSVLDAADAEDANGSAVSLTDVVVRVKECIKPGGDNAVERYDALLMAAGFRYEDDYSANRWQGGERSIYQVSSSFPRLIPANLPSAVRSVKYVLAVGECVAYLVKPETLTSAIASGLHAN
jgi:hypothetical protein